MATLNVETIQSENNKHSSGTRVELKNLTKKFGTVTAVNNVNISIESGEFLTLLGPSGCGKTTILSMILGTLTPTQGEITFDGEPITNIPMNKRDIGMVFQNYALFPHMTVEQNIAFGLDMRKVEKNEKKRRVQEAIDMIQLTGLEKRNIKELSGGQQQRVALARAIVIRPKVLLLDEPLSNLDAKLRKEMRIYLKNLHNELGITTVYVTHDQEEALSLSTKVAVLSNGVVQQIGTPLEIFTRPKNQFVADFVGYTNFIKGTIVDLKDEHFVLKTEDNFQLLVKKVDKHKVGDQITVTIKPENIKSVQSTEYSETNAVSGKIVGRDYMGSTTRYDVQTSNEKIYNVNLLGLTNYELGDQLTLYFPPEDLIILEEE